jgi:hypothetical protein
MKHTYRIRVRPHRYHGLVAAGARPLSPQILSESINGVVVRQVAQNEFGDHVVDLQLQRPSHEDALNEILLVVQQLGYSWLEATVTESVDNAIGGALIGLLGGGVGGAASGDGGVAAGLAFIGLLVGAAVGSFFDQVKVIYEVHRTATGWVFTQLTPKTMPATPVRRGLA